MAAGGMTMHRHEFTGQDRNANPRKVCRCGMNLSARTKRKAKRKEQDEELKAKGIRTGTPGS
jgi:hypothetical protein